MMVHKKLTGAPISLAAAIMLAGSLAGCVSFGGEAPERLLSLSPTQTVAPGTSRAPAGASSLIVADPEAPRMLDTVRVPVQVTPTSVAYVTEVQWADTPRHLFQRLLSETLSATSNRIILGAGQLAAKPSPRLSGDLTAFNIDEATNSAVVTYDAMLTQPNGTLIASQRFTASVPVNGKIDANSVGAPLNAAANKVAGDVAAWIAAQPS